MLYKAATGEKPDLSDIQKFGCKAWVRQEHTKKLNGRALEGKFVTVERDVRFNPDEILASDIQSKGEKVQKEVIVQDITADAPDPVKIPEVQEAPAFEREPSEPSEPQEQEEPEIPRRTRRRDGLTKPEPNTSRVLRARKATNYTDLHHGRVTASAAMEEKHRHPEIEFAMASCGTPGAESRTAQEVLNSPQNQAWAEAMEEEINQLEKAKAWEIVTPPDANVLRSCYVFRTKHDSNNKVDRYTT
ncbi:hypothetical protein B0H19DRAFT_1256287 [Mycena capillaripes]|nr:hypothetical protein B0H19DRAFT_1256287 [Mycena capillaripes]